MTVESVTGAAERPESTVIAAGAGVGGAALWAGTLSENWYVPVVAWPSDAAVRQDTVYLPLASVPVIGIVTPFESAEATCPSVTEVPAESVNVITVNLSSGFSENHRDKAVGAAVSLAFAAGVLRSSRAWAKRSAGVARTAS